MSYVVMLGGIFAVHVLAMISPGPNVLIVTQTAMNRTRRAGIATALGVAAGAAVWSSAALLGLSVLFAQFAWLFGGLKLMGGIYLLYVGIILWRKADEAIGEATEQKAEAYSDGLAFRLGLLTNLTNPKAIIFYGSIFAAFLTPDIPAWVKLMAGGIIVVDSALWHVTLACLFSTRHAQQVYRGIKRWFDRAAGAAFAFLGLWLVVQSR